MEAVGRDWAHLSQVHFGAAALGDARRSRRLVKTAELMFKSPAGSLPDKLPDWADLMGLYRLAAAPQVTHQAVIEPHRQWTLQQMRQQQQMPGGSSIGGVILLSHDTTELDFTGHRAVAAQLGQIGNGGGRGYLCHNTLAIRPGDKRVIGLASQILRQRRTVPKAETARQKREHPERESRLWALGCAQVGPAPAGALWVDICDRGGDCFEFLEYEHAHGRHYVIRSSKDRKLEGDDHLGLDRIHRTLHSYARDLPVLGTRQVELGASTKKGSKARIAKVSIASGPVTLAVPAQPRGQCTATSLDLWVIHVVEVDAPTDAAEPVSWVLLSNVAAADFQQASERVDWYGCRPMIEDYHKGMKSGVGIELPQFESADRLEPVIGLLSVVSAVLLQLRHAARQPQAAHTPATAVVPKLWMLLVASQAYRKPQRELSVQEFFVGVARLGGHLARKNDGPPGWLTLWRGWRKLHLLIDGAQAALAGNCV
jgi:Transposase DNA-binding